MGHLAFFLLHIIAVLFGLIGLLLTIPLHLIYSAVKGKK
jgi:threonine/homoserine/homoserine lactone efflux protein